MFYFQVISVVTETMGDGARKLYTYSKLLPAVPSTACKRAFQIFPRARHLWPFETVTKALARDEKGESPGMFNLLLLYSMIIRNIFQITQRTLLFLLQYILT